MNHKPFKLDPVDLHDDSLFWVYDPEYRKLDIQADDEWVLMREPDANGALAYNLRTGETQFLLRHELPEGIR